MALSAGLFSDLVFAGVIELEESNNSQNPAVRTIDPAPSTDKHPELIVAGYKNITENPNITVDKLLHASWFAQKNEIASALENQGIITLDQGKFLGAKWEKFPTIDSQPEEELRNRLGKVLKGQSEASIQDAVTLIILGEVGNIKLELRKVLNDVSFHDVRTRMRKLGEQHLEHSSEYTIKAVRQTVNSMVSVLSGSAFFMS